MTENTETTPKKTLTLSKKLDVKKIGESDQVRQSFSHGKSKTVTVEVRKKRTSQSKTSESKTEGFLSLSQGFENDSNTRRLTGNELETRMKALQEALKHQPTQEDQDEESYDAHIADETEKTPVEPAQAVSQSLTSKEEEEASTPRHSPKKAGKESEEIIAYQTVPIIPPVITPTQPKIYRASDFDEDSDENAASRRKGSKVVEPKKVVAVSKKEATHAAVPRKLNRNVLTRVLDDEEVERTRSMASMRRAHAKQKTKQTPEQFDAIKIVREVIIPEAITVGELANRMAVRGGDVIKAMMRMGMMVTINQAIDADTAELICIEFNHKPKRVLDSDIEEGLRVDVDNDNDRVHRAPVVTVMGHVDHGKTSLLDALRHTDVVSGEAGGITQHIGAYQITLANGQKITFIDTPGHAAFSEMRARGANVTDIVVLVVAADDGIMEQTLEAINHAKAAQVPIIVAINKMDKPDANPDRVRQELLQHGLVLEDYGGDVMAVEVSAKKQTGLDKLEEIILLQAELLDLKENPNRRAEGVVIEARVERGRGTVATILVQRGTLNVGDVFVAGAESGKVRALVNDHRKMIKDALPAMAVEVIGFNGIPLAGDDFTVVENEERAREISEYRQQKNRNLKAASSVRSSMESMMSQIAAGQVKEMAVLVKTDVQGSLEALSSSLAKLSTNEVSVRILHGAVGAINESDITLAMASRAVIIGFNVRANPQAKELAAKSDIDIRYYSIIYDVIDDVKKILGGLLSPTLREKFLGYASIRNVFNITKVGKVAGCYVTEGVVKRGAKVRLLRDNVVIHEGTLKTLKRFKDEVKEVKESFECGMAFENYNDIRENDVIECFEIESIAREL